MVKVKVKGYDDLVTLVGNLLDVVVGSVLLVEGQWKVDKKYGQQFLAETWEETMASLGPSVSASSSAVPRRWPWLSRFSR